MQSVILPGFSYSLFFVLLRHGLTALAALHMTHDDWLELTEEQRETRVCMDSLDHEYSARPSMVNHKGTCTCVCHTRPFSIEDPDLQPSSKALLILVTISRRDRLKGPVAQETLGAAYGASWIVGSPRDLS